MNQTFVSFLLILSVFGAFATTTAQNATVDSKSGVVTPQLPQSIGAKTIHKVAEGETLLVLAERYAASAEEIRRYNQLPPDTKLRVGQHVVIPGDVVKVAREFVDAANRNLAVATRAEGKTYAPVTYNELSGLVEAANLNFRAGGFEQAIAFSSKSHTLVEDILSQVQKNALRPVPARLLEVEGPANMMLANGKTWKKVRPGDMVPNGAVLQTEDYSKLIVGMPDGSAIDVNGGTELRLDKLQEDQRTGEVESEISVLVGEIIGEIKPRKKTKKPFNIKLDRATIAVRGSVVRAGLDLDKTVRAVNIAGNMDVTLGQQNVVLKPGEGVHAHAGQALSPPKQVLEAPVLIFPKGSPVKTPDQTPDFSWQRVDRPGAGYLVETAKDENFRVIVDRRKTNGVNMPIGPLPVGKYHWRLYTLDENGLQGIDVRQGIIDVENDLKINLTSQQEPVEIGGELVVGPSIIYKASPANARNSVIDYEFEVNGVVVASPGDQVELRESGKYLLVVRGLSETGLRGEPQAVRVNLDADGPEIRIHLAEPRIYANAPEKGPSRALVPLVSDFSQGVEYTVNVDGLEYKNLDRPLLLPTSRAHSVSITAKDRWGNVSTRNLQVDNKAAAPKAEAPQKDGPYFDFLFPE